MQFTAHEHNLFPERIWNVLFVIRKWCLNSYSKYLETIGVRPGGARRAAAPPVTEILNIFRAKRWWFGQKYLGENTLKGSQSYFLLRLPCQDGVKVKWCKDPGKVIYRLNVHRGNLTKWMLLPSTKLWQNQNKRRPRLFVVALKRVVLNGSTKSCFEIFLNFTYCFFYKFLILLGNRSRS